MTLEPRPYGTAALAAAGWTAVALVAYLLLRQPVFYKVDGLFLVSNLEAGRCDHPYNALYMPLLFGLDRLLRPLGLSGFEVAGVLSALGTALGVGIGHLTFARLGLAGWRGHIATLALASTPGIVFFATVVEFHGAYLPFGLAPFLLTAELARRPRWDLAVLLGAMTHLAFLVHATGNLLPGVLLPLFLALRWRDGTRRRDLAVAAVAGGLHLLLFLLLRSVEVPPGRIDDTMQQLFDTGIGQPRGLAWLPRVVYEEWIAPFAPWSLAWLLALLRRDLRPFAAALAIGLGPYLALCMLLLVGYPEFGAYLLPLALPAVWLTVAAVPGRGAVLGVPVALAIALAAVLQHGDDAAQREWLAGARQAAGGRPFVLLLGGPTEMGYVTAAQPDLERVDPLQLLTQQGAPGDGTREQALLDAFVAMQAANGKVVLFTDGADTFLRTRSTGAALAEHALASHDAERVDEGAFGGWILRH